MAKQVQIGINDIPEGWNHNAADFINKLIQRKPENRLGHKTIQELFHHHWFDGFPWDDLKKKTITAPFIPQHKDNYDKKYCEGTDKIGLDTQNRYQQIYNDSQYLFMFNNFTYYGRDVESKNNYHTVEASSNIEKKRCFSANSNNIKIIDTIVPNSTSVNKVKLSHLQNQFKLPLPKYATTHTQIKTSTSINKNNPPRNRRMQSDNFPITKSNPNTFNNTTSSTYNGTQSNNNIDINMLKQRNKTLLMHSYNTHVTPTNSKNKSTSSNQSHHKSTSSHSLNMTKKSKLGNFICIKNIGKNMYNTSSKLFK